MGVAVAVFTLCRSVAVSINDIIFISSAKVIPQARFRLRYVILSGRPILIQSQFALYPPFPWRITNPYVISH